MFSAGVGYLAAQQVQGARQRQACGKQVGQFAGEGFHRRLRNARGGRAVRYPGGRARPTLLDRDRRKALAQDVVHGGGLVVRGDGAGRSAAGAIDRGVCENAHYLAPCATAAAAAAGIAAVNLCPASSSLVLRMTSSTVVRPSRTIRQPSSRRLTIPSRIATCRRWCDGARSRIIERTSLLTPIISKMPWRPRYPVPWQLRQPAPR